METFSLFNRWRTGFPCVIIVLKSELTFAHLLLGLFGLHPLLFFFSFFFKKRGPQALSLFFAFYFFTLGSIIR